MCGIAGFLTYNNFCSEEELHRMTDVLVHRGPDASGYYFEENAGLGHRRLSIIDLSAAANQPMASHNGRYLISYNGEIYNFKEIAKELDVRLKTGSDTEVILEAFARWGVDCVHRFNGMFAIAVLDRQKNELYLFRDRMGIKPLFYYWKDGDFAFASEIKSLLQLSGIKNNIKLNKKAVSEFLYLGYIPEPDTIYMDIRKFPSGHFAIIGRNSFELKDYWKPEEKISATTISNLQKAKKQLDALIIKSVSYRLISDVPYGVFLSGGTDSSIVAAAARKLTDKNLKTFSIGFKESKYNEAGYAKAISEYLLTDHHEFIVSQNDAMGMVEEIIDSYDEPFADSSALPTMLVSKLARKHVTMVLSGDGGDELFHGYGAYRWANRLANPIFKAFRKPIGFGLSQINTRMKRVSQLLDFYEERHLKSHIFSQEQLMFSAREIQELLTEKLKTEFALEENYENLTRTLSPSEQQAFFDLKYYLKDDLLVKVDRASMKYSLEARVPLLDYNIVEFALNIAPSLKINKGVQKYLLKEVLYDYIPKKYFERPKWGFAIPLGKWLRKDLRFMLDKHLSENVVRNYDFVNYKSVRKLKKDFLTDNDSYLFTRLWLLIILHKWAEKAM